MQKLLFIVLLPLIFFLFKKEEKPIPVSIIPPTPTNSPNLWVDPVFTPNYQQVFVVNGTRILVHTPDTTTLNKMLVLSFPGNGVGTNPATDSSQAVGEGIAKKIKNGWNGKQPLCDPGDTAYFVNITFLSNRNCVSSAIDTVIAWAYRYLKVDTTDGRTAVAVLSQGGQDWDKVYSKFGVSVCGTPVNWRYKNKTKIGLFMSTGSYLTDGSYSEGWRMNKAWIYYGGLEVPPFPESGNRLYDTLVSYNGTTQTRKVVVAGQGHNSVVWDSATSSEGSSAANNWWRFAWDTYDCIDTAVGTVIPVNFENSVCFSNCSAVSADSVIQLTRIGNYDPYRGTGTDNQTFNHIPITALEQFGGPKHVHGDHIKWAKRYRIKRIMAKFAGTGVDTMYLYFQNAMQTVAGSNAFDYYTLWRSDTAAMTAQADVRIITTMSPGWNTVWAGDDTLQYAMILSRMQATLQTSVVKLAFYGFELASGEETEFSPLTWAQAAGIDTLRRQTMGEMMGANFANFSLVAAQRWNVNKRDGAEYINYMKGITPNDSVKYINSNSTYLGSVIAQNDSTKIYPFFVNGLDGTASRPANPGTTGFRPLDYTAYASGLKKWTHIYGRNTTNPNIAAPGYIKVAAGYDAIPSYGQNRWQRIDVLNEPNGAFLPDFFMLPAQYAAMHIAVADSVHAADPTMIVESGAIAGSNVEYVRASSRLQMMKVGKTTFRSQIGMFALHKYAVLNKYPYDTSLCTKLRLNRTVQPMDKQYYYDNFRVPYQLAQELGYMPIVDNNEDGADKDGNVIHATDCNLVINPNQFDTSQYNAPPYNGVSNWQRQRIYLMTAWIYYCQSPIRHAAVYWWMDVLYNVKVSYQYSGMLHPFVCGGPGCSWVTPDSTYYYSSFYGMMGMSKRLYDWYPVQVMDTTNGGRHLSKWKKVGFPDSSLIILNLADTLATTVNYTATNVKAGAQYWLPRTTDSAKNDLDVNGTHSAATVVANEVAMTAGFDPVFLFYEEQTLPDPPTCTASVPYPVVNLPQTSIPLTSSVTGSVVTYAWSVQSGESGTNFSAPSSASTTATGLSYTSVATRTYVFKLTVEDGNAQQGTCTVSVTVNRNYIPGRLRKKKLIQVQ